MACFPRKKKLWTNPLLASSTYLRSGPMRVHPQYKSIFRTDPVKFTLDRLADSLFLPPPPLLLSTSPHLEYGGLISNSDQPSLSASFHLRYSALSASRSPPSPALLLLSSSQLTAKKLTYQRQLTPKKVTSQSQLTPKKLTSPRRPLRIISLREWFTYGGPRVTPQVDGGMRYSAQSSSDFSHSVRAICRPRQATNQKTRSRLISTGVPRP